jgi:hypothetical protein
LKKINKNKNIFAKINKNVRQGFKSRINTNQVNLSACIANSIKKQLI